LPESQALPQSTEHNLGRTITKLFGDLKVRPKLMVLHNIFFAVLAAAVYFALFPYLSGAAKTNLFIVLGAIYVVAVLLL